MDAWRCASAVQVLNGFKFSLFMPRPSLRAVCSPLRCHGLRMPLVPGVNYAPFVHHVPNMRRVRSRFKGVCPPLRAVLIGRQHTAALGV